MKKLSVYRVHAKRSYNNFETKYVLATLVQEAADFFVRHGKKSYWSDIEVLEVQKHVGVDVHYRK